MKKLQGIISALMTPFDENHQVDHTALRRLVTHQREMGVEGYFVGGNSARYYLLDERERKEMLETVLDTVGGDALVIAHVGSRDLRVALRLTQHAEQAGAHAVGSILPEYTFEASLDYYRRLAGETGLPLLAYIFSVGQEVQLDFVRALTEIPNFAGVKFTSTDLFRLERIGRMKGGTCVVLSGWDQVFAAARIMGAAGAIGSTYNLMPDIYAGIVQALEAGDTRRAGELQTLANDQTELLQGIDVIRGMRYILATQGVIGGHVRPPFASLSEEEKEVCEVVTANLEDFRRS